MTKKIEVNKWDKYWMLTIIKEVCWYTSPKWHKRRCFKCQCECWNIKIIKLGHLRNWGIKSCWCLLLKGTNTKHKLSYTKIYNTFNHIKQRCNNKNNKDYKNYWARWIKCEWDNVEDFNNDMWKIYKKHFKENNWDTTIERIEVNWNYNKKNCVWATLKEQARNKRNTIKYNWIPLITLCENNWINYKNFYNKHYAAWTLDIIVDLLAINNPELLTNPWIIESKSKLNEIKTILNN